MSPSHNPPSPHSPHNSNTPTTTIHQFYTDAPRISFYFNATEFTKNVAVLHQRVVQFCQKHKMDVDTLLLWCTQTALAPLFVEKHSATSKHNDHHHLFDNGRQRITFDDHTGAMHIVKPFRVDEEDTTTLQFHTTKHLTLHVTLQQNEEPIVDWVEHTPPGAMQFVEQVGAVGMVCALAMAYFVVHHQC